MDGPASHSATYHGAAGRLVVPSQQPPGLVSAQADGQYVTIPLSVLLEWQEQLRVINEVLQGLLRAEQPQDHPAQSFIDPGAFLSIVNSPWTNSTQPTYHDLGGITSGPSLLLPASTGFQYTESSTPLAPRLGTPSDMLQIGAPSFVAASAQQDASAAPTRRKKRAKIACDYCHSTRKTCEDMRPCWPCIRNGRADTCCDWVRPAREPRA
ncbi:hypothetical protein C8T65DRAFT_662075 [Cerioporus squamosus]|nr:hypothetical protein C8T65DRAFT_662075 [Cerioporus squamosus]